jgi:ribose 5-phosphate isomerase A
VEVAPFGLASTQRRLTRACAAIGLTGPIALRMREDKIFVTDGGHYILDCAFGEIPDPERLAATLNGLPGIVEHGLFLGLASFAIVGGPHGADVLRSPTPDSHRQE